MQQVLKPPGAQMSCHTAGLQDSSLATKALRMLELQAAQKEDTVKITAWAEQTQGCVDTIPPGQSLTVPCKFLSRSVPACLSLPSLGMQCCSPEWQVFVASIQECSCQEYFADPSLVVHLLCTSLSGLLPHHT